MDEPLEFGDVVEWKSIAKFVQLGCHTQDRWSGRKVGACHNLHRFDRLTMCHTADKTYSSLDSQTDI